MDETKSNKNIYPWLLSGLAILMSAFAYVLFVYWFIPEKFFTSLDKSWFNVMFLYFLAAVILSTMGLVIGIKRRKTVSRLSGILGIIISIITIILTIFSGIGVELSIILSTT